MKYYLISGATGYIGSNLIRRLLEKKDIIIYGISRSESSIKHERYHHVVSDISRLTWQKKIKHSISIVIHLAHSNKYKEFLSGTEDVLKTNIISTYLLLDWAMKNRIKKFLFASTGSVYKQNKKPLTEDDLCEPDSMYTASKLSAELIIKQYSQYFSVVIMRLFGVYGPWQQNKLVPLLIDNIKHDKEIILAKKLGIIITPIFIFDCVEMITRLIDLNLKNRYEIYNIAGDKAYSLKEMAEIIGKKLKVKPKIKNNDNNPKYYIASIDKICSSIKYHPQTSFSDGIDSIVNIKN